MSFARITIAAMVLGAGPGAACSSSTTEAVRDAAVAGSGGSGSGGAVANTGGQTGTGGGSGAGTGGTITGGTGGAGSGGITASGGNGGSAGTGGNAGSTANSGGTSGAGGRAGAAGNAATGGTAGAAGAAGAAATGGRGGGNGGAAGAASYSPCPAPPALCKILPFGDSITFGVGSNGSGSNGGYRVELFHRAHQDAKSITFVGTAAANGPTTVDGVTFPRQHEGHSGYTIDNVPATAPGGARTGISPLVATVLAATKPDIVTLMIGTNDVQHDIDVANAPARVGKLLDSIIATDVHTLVVVAQIVPTTDATINAAVQAFNSAIPALVSSRVAAGKHLVLVDMYRPIATAPGFQTSGRTVPDNTVGPMYDWLHPNVAGYKLMGDAWYDAIKSALR